LFFFFLIEKKMLFFPFLFWNAFVKKQVSSSPRSLPLSLPPHKLLLLLSLPPCLPIFFDIPKLKSFFFITTPFPSSLAFFWFLFFAIAPLSLNSDFFGNFYVLFPPLE